jgi:hypothetical protein
LVSLAWTLRADLRRKEGVLFSIFFAVLKGRSSTTTPRFLLDNKSEQRVKLEIRSRAKMRCVERSLKTEQSVVSNQPSATFGI